MKILGLANKDDLIHKQLIDYTFSFFKEVPTEIIELEINKVGNGLDIKPIAGEYSFLDILKQSSLTILAVNIACDSDQKILAQLLKAQSKMPDKKPVLLLIVSNENVAIEGVMDQVNIQISAHANIDTYILPNYLKNFDGLEISNIRLRLELIRLVNYLMYHELGIRDDSYFTCGIDPDRDYCGDAIEY